jgi:hypothetical protein
MGENEMSETDAPVVPPKDDDAASLKKANTDAATDLIKQFVVYGDAIVGFVIAQVLALAYALGNAEEMLKEGASGSVRKTLRTHFNEAGRIPLWVATASALLYFVFAACCHVAEINLRKEVTSRSTVHEYARWAYTGRSIIIIVAALMANLTIYMNMQPRPHATEAIDLTAIVVFGALLVGKVTLDKTKSQEISMSPSPSPAKDV